MYIRLEIAGDDSEGLGEGIGIVDLVCKSLNGVRNLWSGQGAQNRADWASQECSEEERVGATHFREVRVLVSEVHDCETVRAGKGGRL